MEPIILTPHQYEDALRGLPNPHSYQYLKLGHEVLAPIQPEVFFPADHTENPSPSKFLSKMPPPAAVIRFRINLAERLLPFWEPTQDILIKSPSK